jgi:hypothetical protein
MDPKKIVVIGNSPPDDSAGRQVSGPVPRDRTTPEYDVFVIYADADASFVKGYLLPELGLPADRVFLSNDLTPGASLVSEIERGVTLSARTLVVLVLKARP